MFLKFIKWSFKILASILLLIALLYGGFHLWEYSTGGKYVKYLTENSETISLEETFSYNIIGQDIEKNQLILVGEIHGFGEPAKFDVDFFKFLHQNHGVKHYIAEADFVQAILLNQFLKTGNQELLEKALRKWVVLQGRNNKTYFNKYVQLHDYYNQLAEDDKFEFVGIDAIRDGDLCRDYLATLYPDSISITKEDAAAKSITELIDELSPMYKQNADTLFILSHLKLNVQHAQEKVSREEAMFQNFSNLYKAYELSEHKLYGFMGLTHVFQYRINGNHPLASKIRMSDLDVADKILSVNMMMNDSYMVMAGDGLPSFMTEGGAYARMPVSADNLLFMYIVGVKDFKRMTPEHHKSLIKMNGADSPYAKTARLSRTIQLIPVTSVFEMTDKGKPYVQYTLFVRNSDWAEPIKE